MKKNLILGLILFSAVLAAQEPDSSSAVFSLLEAERSFAKASVMNGRRDAFYEFLAERSVIFTDKWITNAREFWVKRPATLQVLKWEPEYQVLSSGRDFGISTGPWESQEYRPNTKALSSGYFLSAWEIQQDGSWKVILDGGITSPPTRNPHSFSFEDYSAKSLPGGGVTISGTSLETAEAKMLDLWKSKPGLSSYRSFLDPKVRFMRNGHLPTTEPDSVNKWISGIDRSISWKTAGSHVSSAGDLGFTYGYIEKPDGAGNYIRFWRRDASGNWKIIIDMMSL